MGIQVTNETGVVSRKSQLLATIQPLLQQKAIISASTAELNKGLAPHEGVNSTDVQVVAEGRNFPLSKMNPMERVGIIGLTIQWASNNYGARHEVDQSIIDECLEITEEQFSYLGAEELKQAYRLWAGGKFEALEMYGGQFNATHYARVLKGYAKYRKKINTELARQKAELIEAERKKKRKAKWAKEKAERLLAFPALLDKAMSTAKYSTPESVPTGWYEMADELGLLEWSDERKEKWAFLKKARKIIYRKRKRELESTPNKITRKALMDHYRNPSVDDGMALAQKIAVFEKLLYGRKFIDLALKDGRYASGFHQVPGHLYSLAVAGGCVVYMKEVSQCMWKEARQEAVKLLPAKSDYMKLAKSDRGMLPYDLVLRHKVMVVHGQLYLWYQLFE